jgi:hypothetical protein
MRSIASARKGSEIFPLIKFTTVNRPLPLEMLYLYRDPILQHSETVFIFEPLDLN